MLLVASHYLVVSLSYQSVFVFAYSKYVAQFILFVLEMAFAFQLLAAAIFLRVF